MTDVDASLAVLASEYQSKDVADLYRALVAAGGNVGAARQALARGAKRRKINSLGEWLKPQGDSINIADASTSRITSRKTDTTPPGKFINDALKRDLTAPTPPTLKPVTLTTPESIARHLPCSLELNILPAELASDLFLEMMTESETWTRNKWYMVDREVESPHLTAFYGDETVADEASAHWHLWYGGKKVAPPRRFTALMLRAREIIEDRVATALAKRKRDPREHATPWRANVSAANRYYGRASNVGFHSDQLTYIGPAPTIASLSLGCQRIFRLRGGHPAQTFNIPLPTNSLLLMHAGCQERYKHSIPPATALDVYKPVTDPEKRSFSDRINMTFRFYRPDFSSPPLCACGVPCLLRSDLKFNAKVDGDAANRYFWACQLDMKGEGKGPCIGEISDA